MTSSVGPPSRACILPDRTVDTTPPGWSPTRRIKASAGSIAHADDVDVERFEPLDRPRPDGTESDHRGRAPRELDERPEVLPPSLLLAAPPLVEPPGNREHPPDDVLGYVRDADAAGVRHRDAAGLQGAHRQVADPGRPAPKYAGSSARSTSSPFTSRPTATGASVPGRAPPAGSLPSGRRTPGTVPLRFRAPGGGEPVGLVAQHGDVWGISNHGDRRPSTGPTVRVLPSRP